MINPWFFYLLQISDMLSNICQTITMVVSVTISVVILFDIIASIYIFKEGGDDFPNHLKLKPVKALLCIYFIAILLVTFIPTKSTIISMMVAQNITYERVDIAGEKIELLIEKIIDKSAMINKKRG